MYDKALDTFICAADCGSFSKAAEKLFLTHTAVIKQINALEKELDVQLFFRTNHGISLTAAGCTLYEEAENLRAAAKAAVQRVKDAEEMNKVLRIGSSPLFPCQPFLKLWSENAALWPKFRVEIVPFSEDDRYMEYLGQDYDLFIGPFGRNEELYRKKQCRFFRLSSCDFHIAVPQRHRLAEREQLALFDLAGETLEIVKAGISPVNDAVRRAAKAAGVLVEDVLRGYDMQTFNRCAESGKLLLSLSCWANIYPGLRSVPLAGDFSMPYGIMASADAAKRVEDLLNTLPKADKSGEGSSFS